AAMPVLVESLRREQQRRWEKGDRVVVESFLTQYPDLRADQNGVLQLIYSEVLLREAVDESAELDEYVRRFPHLAAQLSPLFEVHRALESATSDFASLESEQPGTVIGPYKLLQQIGEGGMGTVYMAEQTHPVQRKVALKLIRPGMDSRQV